MSRIGRRPIVVPKEVKVNILSDRIEFESAKGKLDSPLFPGIDAKIGITAGYSKHLEIVGVGYKAKLEKDVLELNLGYSRPILYKVPTGIQVILAKPTLITVKGMDKQQVGQVAEEIKRFRKPDPYKLKGVRFVGEKLIKKERKAGVSSV
jgi:large subunit ribosomal protein L6